jgi:hypothetical protein
MELKKTTSSKFNLLCEAYGDDTLSRVLCLNPARGVQKEGRMWKMTNDLVTMSTDENVEKVFALVRANHHLGIKLVAEELNMDKETVRHVLTTNLNIIAKNLTEDL